MIYQVGSHLKNYHTQKLSLIMSSMPTFLYILKSLPMDYIPNSAPLLLMGVLVFGHEIGPKVQIFQCKLQSKEQRLLYCAISYCWKNFARFIVTRGIATAS